MKKDAPLIKLLIATRNLHKIREVRDILGKGLEFLTLKDFPGVPNVAEDARTFSGNASKKALHVALWLSLNGPFGKISPHYVIADDSGLEVDALGGDPGVHSARFAATETGAKGNSPDADNLAKLLRLLRGVRADKRTARFRCVIALVPTNARKQTRTPQLFGGVCEGHIALKPRGEGGFGYDPVFTPNGCSKTFAELGEDVKNRLSHRANALAGLKMWLAKGLVVKTL